MTFGKWLRQQAKRDDPIGDVARDWKSDSCGKRLSSPKGMRNHMIDKHSASANALNALEMARKEWNK